MSNKPHSKPKLTFSTNINKSTNVINVIQGKRVTVKNQEFHPVTVIGAKKKISNSPLDLATRTIRNDTLENSQPAPPTKKVKTSSALSQDDKDLATTRQSFNQPKFKHSSLDLGDYAQEQDPVDDLHPEKLSLSPILKGKDLVTKDQKVFQNRKLRSGQWNWNSIQGYCQMQLHGNHLMAATGFDPNLKILHVAVQCSAKKKATYNSKTTHVITTQPQGLVMDQEALQISLYALRTRISYEEAANLLKIQPDKDNRVIQKLRPTSEGEEEEGEEGEGREQEDEDGEEEKDEGEDEDAADDDGGRGADKNSLSLDDSKGVFVTSGRHFRKSDHVKKREQARSRRNKLCWCGCNKRTKLKEGDITLDCFCPMKNPYTGGRRPLIRFKKQCFARLDEIFCERCRTYFYFKECINSNDLAYAENLKVKCNQE